jgi:hypothetical protein
MRGLRSTLALLAVFIGLGAYIYFVTWKQPESPASDLEKVFASVESDAIDEVTVKSASGDVTTIKKAGGAWAIVAPVSVPAAEAEATGLTSALAQLELVRVIDPNPSSLGEFGLEKPRVEVEFKGPNNVSGRLYLGDKTPTGTGLYARRNDDKQVFLVSEYRESALNRSTFDLRDKTLVIVPRAKVQSVQIANGPRTIVLTKKDDAWRLSAPLDARADFSAAEAILGRIESALVKSIVSEQAAAADLKAWGLDEPQVRLTIQLEGSTTVLEFGDDAESGGVYAREAAKPSVVTVDKSLVDELKKSPEDYRQREVFSFRAFNATRAEFTWSGKSIVMERVEAAGDTPEKWKRVSPTAGDLDRGQVDGLLNGLSDMRATAFKDSQAGTGIDAPALTVAVTFEQGKKNDRATFGKVGDQVHAARPGDPGVAVVDTEGFAKALTALDELLK